MKIRRLFKGWKESGNGSLEIDFVRRGGWLAHSLTERFSPPRLAVHALVEKRARETDAAGDRPLWEGYREVANYPRATSGTRRASQVSTNEVMGRLFSWLAASRDKPNIVEFGTAFGVSGMYWLAGIGGGHLYTFEPNPDWAALARENLAAISERFTLTTQPFETAGPRILKPASIEIAFVDAIHTSDFVFSQYEILKPLMKPSGLIIFDDINFSPDMMDCWKAISEGVGVAASVSVAGRAGMIELPS